MRLWNFLHSEGNKYAGNRENDKFNGKGNYEGDINFGSIEGNGIFFSKKEKI